MNADVDVLVAGAGISGLALAFDLQRRGLSLEVFDAAGHAGGVIGTRRREGALIEAGPNSTLDSTPLIGELLGALGIRDTRVEVNDVAARRYIVREGKLVALPTSPPALLSSRAFSFGAKLRLLREPLVRAASPDLDESVAAFARRRLGTEVLDYAVDPFVSGIYAGDPERISLPAAFPRLHAIEQMHGSLLRGQLKEARLRKQKGEGAKPAARSFSFREGMQTLTDALYRSVSRVHVGSRVQALDRIDAGWRVTAARGAETIVRCARAVVLAVPANDASDLVRALAPPAAQALAGIDYAPIASVATLYRREAVAHRLDGFGFLVPGKERRSILGTLFSSSMFAGRAPAGSVLLTSFVGGRRQPELLTQPDPELAALVHRELSTLIGAREAPSWAEITRWTRAIPQYEIGHRERMRVLDDAERSLPGVYFCANYRGGVSIGDRIRMAHESAEAIVGYIGNRG